MEGWIKLYRKFIEWEWFRNSEMVHLFIYMLLKANTKDSRWQGINVQRGQLITGRQKLSQNTGISERSIRTCLERLKSTNEIAIKTTNQYSIITIINYDSYQTRENRIDQQTDQQTDQRLTSGRPTIDQQPTTNKNNKNIRNKEYKNILMSELSASDVIPEHFEYLEIAKAFFELFRNNLQEAGASTVTLEKAKGTWVDDIRLTIENDNYTVEDLREVWQFLRISAFWKKNILSTATLREKMSKLKLEIHNGTNQRNRKEGCTWDELACVVKNFAEQHSQKN